MASILEVVEGMQYQTSDEEMVYTITTTNVASSPSSPAVVAYDEGNETAVTTTVFPTNTPSAATDTITLSPLKSLTKGHVYRIEVKFTVGSSIYERYFRVTCER